jgi:hypothetical protein
MSRPLSVSRCGWLLRNLSNYLARAIEADWERVRFNDQLRLAHQREVAHNLLLALHVLLVLVAAVSHLLGRSEEGVEQAEIHA